MIILHAPNVHCGGGMTLLQSLVKELPEQAYLIVDERFPLEDNVDVFLQVKRVKPTLWGRFGAELFLRRHVQGDDVLCFGNLPPLFKLKGNVRLFLQNRYLIDDVPLNGFPFMARIRIQMERWWLKLFVRNVDSAVVQTLSMQALFERRLSISAKVLPFVADMRFFSSCTSEVIEHGKRYEFIYVASGEPHKNHRNLIQAWVILSRNGLFPHLHLTLNANEFSGLLAWIEQQKGEYGLNIQNEGVVSGSDMLDVYSKAQALIFPSALESFGIPLIEARSAGLAIVASELDYVRDVVDPEETFDPTSPISIARAVKRFLGAEDGAPNLLDAKAFLERM